MQSRSLPAALAAAALLAVPATASAGTPVTVTAGPVKVKSYELFVMGSDGGSKDSATFMLTRRSGGSTQTHTYSFSSGISVKASSNLRSASIKGSLGRFGKVNLKFSPGAAAKGVIPKGCKGTPGKARKGTLKGAFRFVADSTYFKTIKKKSMKGSVGRGGVLKCEDTSGGGSGGSGSTSGTTLSSTQQGDAGMLMLSISRAGSKVFQSVFRTDNAAKTAPATITHSISATTGASGLEPSADGSSATAKAAGPFLTGSLSFAGESMGSGFATGTLSGDFAAKFDSIGTQSLAASGPDAQLMTR